MSGQGPELLARGRGLMAAVLDLGRTRLALAGVELEEERLRLAELLLWAIATLFFFALGIIFVAALLVLLAWNGPREWVLAALAGLFLGAAAGSASAWRRRKRDKPALLAATLAELKADVAAMSRRTF